MEKDINGILRESWEEVGRDLRQATVEVAQSIGGQDVAMETITLAGDPSQAIPNPESLQFLETNFSGSAESVISRAEQIQKARHERERENFVTRIFKRRE